MQGKQHNRKRLRKHNIIIFKQNDRMCFSSKKVQSKNKVNIQKETSSLKNATITAYEKYHKGIITEEELQKEFALIDSKSNEIQALNQNNDTSLEKDFLLQYNGIKKLTREIVETLINKIYIWNDRIEIKWNFSDELTKAEL